MIYQPRNVQPSGVSIDGLLDNTFTMEIQTNSYVSAYQLLIVDFDNNKIYTGSKTTLTNYAYNGDILEIPVSASAVALSNGTNYKWRVRLYQPTADMLITYGLVQATSTTTTIYLQPNINIKAGMAITINSQTKTISSYNSDTGVAVVSSAFSSAPAVGTQYKIYSDFIETVPDYIVYARRTPAVAISNVPSSLTLKYHTFQGTYTQSDNVPIVYHKFDLYTKNDDGTISLVASSDKVYSANLSYTYDSFRTGNKYLIQMTVENDMGVITTTDMYEFNVSYDIVEYLQQPLASFDDKNNAVKVSWVTPVEHDATSFRSDAATGTIQDNNNTLTQATFEPGQSIGEGDVVQITNSDCTLVIDGKSTQATRSGKNLFNYDEYKKNVSNLTLIENGFKTNNYSCWSNKKIDFLEKGETYTLSVDIKKYGSQQNTTASGTIAIRDITNNRNIGYYVNGSTFTIPADSGDLLFYFYGASPVNDDNYYEFKKIQIEKGSTATAYEPYGVSPSPDYPSEIDCIKGKNLFDYTKLNNENTIQWKAYENLGTSFRALPIYVGKNKQVYFSSNVPALTSENAFYAINNINNGSSNVLNINNSRVISSNNDGYVYLGVVTNRQYYSEVQSNEYWIMISTDNQPYLPYNTIEVKSTGKNKANIKNYSNTINGVTLTINNGEITLNGTATRDFTFTNLGEFLYKAGKSYSGTFIYLSGSCTDYGAGIYLANSPTSNINIGGGSAFRTNQSRTFNIIGKTEDLQEYFYVTGKKESVYTNYKVKVQIVEGTTADYDYEPYKSNTSLIDLQGNELCSLPNGTKDELVVENGKAKIIKKVGKIVLDGSENWNVYTTTNSQGNTYGYHISLSLQPLQETHANNFALSNYFIQQRRDAVSVVDTQGIYLGSGTTMFIKIAQNLISGGTIANFKTWLSTHNVEVLYELAEPYLVDLGDSAVPYIDGVNYMYILSNINTTFSLKYPHKTISGNAYDYTEFNPPGVKQTGTIKSYNAITGVGTLMAQYPFTYIPMQGDSYAVISNIYNVSGFSYLYNTPYNTVNSLYTHGYTATWATPDGLCVLPDDFNITLQFSPDGSFFYNQNGVYQEVVDLITTETDDPNNEGEFTIKIDKNKLIFVQNPDISLELPFYTNTTQVFVLSSASVAQINNDYVWDDTATWTDTYTWVEGGTSLERVCNHWWKVQITNTGIKIEEIFPTT